MIENMLGGIGPKVGLNMLSKLMPERVGHPVEHFEMRVFANDKRIDFLIYMPESHFKNLSDSVMINKYNNEKHCHLYKFEEGEKICMLIVKLISSKLPVGYNLDYIIIDYDKNNDTKCSAYGTTKNGIKEKQTINL